MPEQLIGTVVHYFKGPSVAVVRVTEGTLAVGDRIHQQLGVMRAPAKVDHSGDENAGVEEDVPQTGHRSLSSSMSLANPRGIRRKQSGASPKRGRV